MLDTSHFPFFGSASSEGQITLYGAEKLHGDRPLFIVEAELDALLLWQAVGDVVDAVALAGAGRTLPAQWLARLLPYTRIFAALDADKAGTLNATRLAALSARVTPVRVPECYQAGGDVRAWVMEVAGDDTRVPLRVVIPPDEARLPGLAVPAGRWQRQDDGSIVVVYASAEEMAVCREATRVCGESEYPVSLYRRCMREIKDGAYDRSICICRETKYALESKFPVDLPKIALYYKKCTQNEGSCALTTGLCCWRIDRPITTSSYPPTGINTSVGGLC